MRLIVFSSILLFACFSANAQQPSDWPLRAIEVDSTFTVLPEILPSQQFEKGRTYQNGEPVFPGTPDWDENAPFCRVDYSSITMSFINVYEDDVFKVTGISGRYNNRSYEVHYDHPYFETEFTLTSVDDPKHFFFVKCFSYKKDHFGEMTLDQLFKTFGHRLTAHQLNLKSPGKYSSAPINSLVCCYWHSKRPQR
jgi:hypothetical protein